MASPAARWPSVLGVLLVPLGLVAWVVYRDFVLGDATFDWREPYSVIYGILISPSATHIVSDQRITFSWEAVCVALRHPSATNAIDLGLGSVFFVVLAAGVRRLWAIRRSYVIYSAATVLASFSLSTGVPHAFMGLPRHCLLAFPVAILLAARKPDAALAQAVRAVGLLSLAALPVLAWKILWIP